MTEQTWSDERIQQRYDELNRIAPGYPDLNMRDVAREIRDDLQQRIDALEAENARLRAMMPSAEVRAALNFLYGSKANRRLAQP